MSGPPEQLMHGLNGSMHDLRLRQPGSFLRQRKQTITRQWSPSQQEALGRLRINMGKQRHHSEAQSKTEFKANLALSLRTSCGVLVASAFLTKSNETWACFPDWYILGGVSFIAVACVFGAGKNVGGTMREMFQQKAGIAMAFLFNAVLFWCFQPQVFSGSEEVDTAIKHGTLVRITKSFNGVPYYVHTSDFYTVLPFTMGFNAFILFLPFVAGTKKFAMVNNLYFALAVVSPNKFNNSSSLKDSSGDYSSTNIVNNLLIYMCLGIIGTFLAFLFIWFPYPLFAIRSLQKEVNMAADTIQDLLHVIVDTYCFRSSDVENMHLGRVTLERKFDLAMAKKDCMVSLLNDAWWEQGLGLAYAFSFQKTVIQPYIVLYISLLDNLRAMNQAIQLEHCDHWHALFMKALQKHIYGVQIQAVALLKEISRGVQSGKTDLMLTRVSSLESQIRNLLKQFHATQLEIYTTKHPTPADIEGNIPLNLFIFSLQSFCTMLVNFQSKINNETHATMPRMSNFIKRSISDFISPAKYSRRRLQTAFKVWLALLIACFICVYVFSYSSTTATTIAYVMGNQIGGSFSVTLNRAVGVVAGVIVPSVALFFICAYTESHVVIVIFRDMVLFVWTTMSMYIKWKGGLDAYAGFVSAFIVAGTLLPDDICPAPGSLAPYSNLVQMSLGVLLIILIELGLWPESAFILMRKNVQKHLRLLQTSFIALFEQNLKSNGTMDSQALQSIRDIVKSQAPALLKEQKLLLREALFEPRLWRPAFSSPKYEKVVNTCERLLNDTMILYKLVVWFHNCRPKINQHQSVNEERAWEFSTEALAAAIHDTFDMLHDLFGINFRYADCDQTALFVQMKEAFREADKDNSGELDVAEVHLMLRRVFELSGTLPIDAIDTYVHDFMEIVSQQRTGTITFEEFVQALQNGLFLEIEVVHTKSPSSTFLEKDTCVDPNPLLSPTSHVSCDPISPGRAHDILAIDKITLLDASRAMRRAYALWLMEGENFKSMSMDEVLLLNSMISGVCGIARNLALMEEAVIQP